MTFLKRFVFLVCVAGGWTSTALAQAPAAGMAPSGADVPGVWHLGRVTGDLERIIAFYHDLLGLGLRGARNQPRLFTSNKMNNEFVNAPASAEYRAASMPIPGASAAAELQNQVYLEAFEYRNIERRPDHSGAGQSGCFEPASPRPRSRQRRGGGQGCRRGSHHCGWSAVAGADASRLNRIVAGDHGQRSRRLSGGADAGDARAAIGRTREKQRRRRTDVSGRVGSLGLAEFLPPLHRLRLTNVGRCRWQTSKAFTQLRGIPDAEYRTAAALLPGSAVRLELVRIPGGRADAVSTCLSGHRVRSRCICRERHRGDAESNESARCPDDCPKRDLDAVQSFTARDLHA